MDKIIIEVVELCRWEHEDSGEIFYNGKRVFHYQSDKKYLVDAINDIANNFNSANIVYCEDYFNGACLDSVEISFSLLED